MKSTVWLVLLFVVAVVAAMTLGANDGLASLYWRGWRLDLSLNLLVLCLVLAFAAAHSGTRLLRWLLGLPQRAKAWRERRREQALVSSQHEAWAELLSARYSRALKSSVRAVALQQELGDRSLAGAQAQAVSHLLAASAAHRLQDRSERDQHLGQLRQLLTARGPGESLAEQRRLSLWEGSLLLQAEWALDDRDASAALAALDQLAPGAARRIQAQRLRMQALRATGQPLEAMRSARLLAKHQAFKPAVAQGLLRSLATEVVDEVRDLEGLQKCWMELDREDRKDLAVTLHVARRAAEFEAHAWARRLLKPWLEDAAELSPDDRRDVILAVMALRSGIEAEWLALVESLISQQSREPLVAALAGLVFAERQLWGKARTHLEQAVANPATPLEVLRPCLRLLGDLAHQRGDTETAMTHYRRALATL